MRAKRISSDYSMWILSHNVSRKDKHGNIDSYSRVVIDDSYRNVEWIRDQDLELIEHLNGDPEKRKKFFNMNGE